MTLLMECLKVTNIRREPATVFLKSNLLSISYDIRRVSPAVLRPPLTLETGGVAVSLFLSGNITQPRK